MSHVIVMEGNLCHEEDFMKRIMEVKNAINSLERVYGLYVLTVRKPMVFL